MSYNKKVVSLTLRVEEGTNYSNCVLVEDIVAFVKEMLDEYETKYKVVQLMSGESRKLENRHRIEETEDAWLYRNRGSEYYMRFVDHEWQIMCGDRHGVYKFVPARFIVE